MLYKDFKPTMWDQAGIMLAEKQDWHVLGIGTNRDSGRLERHNFDTVCKRLKKIDPEGVMHSVERFGHWACGWFEIILAMDNSLCYNEFIKIEKALDEYPILDEDNFEFGENDAN